MKNNRILRVFLIVGIGAGLGFLDYKTPVKSGEVEVLDVVADVLIANQKTTGRFPESLQEAGYGNMGFTVLRYQKVSDTEFTLAYTPRDFYIDHNKHFYAANVFVGLKLWVWEKYKFMFEYYYLFVCAFGLFAMYMLVTTMFGNTRRN